MKIHKDVKIGHIHLSVANLENSLKFYRDILGFDVTSKIGDSAVFLSAGGYHHHIALNTWSKLGTRPPAGHIGLYHFAILYPSREELAKTLQNIIENKYPLSGAADHDVSEAIYLEDPDGNGVELYVDRPEEKWEKSEKGEIKMSTKRLDIQDLLDETNKNK
jgi:catechol 2,3-dioxygenase